MKFHKPHTQETTQPWGIKKPDQQQQQQQQKWIKNYKRLDTPY